MKNGTETDFVVKEGLHLTKRIQVWYDDATETSIPPREMAAFREGGGSQAPVKNILITNDYEDFLDPEGLRVRCIPAAKFLLFDFSEEC